MVPTGQENGQANLNYFMVSETRETKDYFE